MSGLHAMAPPLFQGIYAGKKVLLTGHTGFKGSWLALWLHQLGAQVHGLSLPAATQPNHLQLSNLPITESLIDLRDAEAVTETVTRFQPEMVFHLGAQALVRRSYQAPIDTYATNVMGLVNLLEAVRQTPSVRAVVNATTDKCYENRHTTIGYQESDALGGHDPYSASKACAEIVSASYRASFLRTGQGAAIVQLATARAGNVIGGGDWADDRLIPDLVRATLSHQATHIRSPHATRPWQHVLEPLSAYLLIGQRLLQGDEAVARAWNIGPNPDGHWPVGQVTEAFQRHWPEVEVTLDRSTQPHEASLLHLDCSQAHAALGWHPTWSTDTAIERTARWYQQHASHGVINSQADLAQFIADARQAQAIWSRP